MNRRSAGGHRASLVVAADVLVYVGDLEAFFASAAHYMESNALLAFTLEDCPAEECVDGFKLQRSGRFTHSLSYVENLAAASGLVASGLPELVPVRTEGGEPVQGRRFLFRSPNQGGADEL
jgi:predicted TPR repeat methyltransferase